jgi:CrcB protein
VNVAGSLAMGWFVAVLAPAWHPLVLTGLLGGFTTFSAFSLDVLRLVEGGRPAAAALYAGGSVVLSCLACAAGLALGRAG